MKFGFASGRNPHCIESGERDSFESEKNHLSSPVQLPCRIRRVEARMIPSFNGVFFLPPGIVCCPTEVPPGAASR
jgi:hypothetical protein